jgi:flagellar basal-body rod protein FlgC
MAGFNTSLSALQASTELLNVSAHNTANANTDGFQKINATLNEGKNGGVVVKLGENEQTGPAYQVQTTGEPEPSNTNIAEESVNQILAEYLLKANIEAIKTQDEMNESLLDVLA